MLRIIGTILLVIAGAAVAAHFGAEEGRIAMGAPGEATPPWFWAGVVIAAGLGEMLIWCGRRHNSGAWGQPPRG